MRRRARQIKPEMLGDVLRKILKKRNIPHTSTDRRLLAIWRRAVGPQIAAQTHPDSLKRGVLFVRVSAPVWMHQLTFMREEILARIRELAAPEEVRNLRFTIGEIPPDPSGRAYPAAESVLPPAPLAGRDRTMVLASLETVRDPELRTILERVMTREIGRRREREKR
ncbi:MAG: DciA family protein [Syntrophales bacterium]